jgi:poly-beta-hydroxyalkanoate depolymerase
MLATIEHTLGELSHVIGQLNQSEYSKPLAVLSDSTIGQHTRHSIEMFQCLLKGYERGSFSYDNRQRDLQLETDIAFAQKQLKLICFEMKLPNKALTSTYKLGESNVEVETNFFRELVFNLEHCIHHNALIRIGVNATTDIVISEHFGVAPSTMEYRKSCAFSV